MISTTIEKEKIELEFILKGSPKVLENRLFTASGLSEWFADDVKIKEDVYTFIWNGSEQKAKLIGQKSMNFIRFQWMDDETCTECYFEMSMSINQMTSEIILKITDFSDEDELEESILVWEHAVADLKRTLGS